MSHTCNTALVTRCNFNCLWVAFVAAAVRSQATHKRNTRISCAIGLQSSNSLESGCKRSELPYTPTKLASRFQRVLPCVPKSFWLHVKSSIVEISTSPCSLVTSLVASQALWSTKQNNLCLTEKLIETGNILGSKGCISRVCRYTYKIRICKIWIQRSI